VREFAAREGLSEEHARAEGMAQESARFKAAGGEIYIPIASGA